MPYHQHTSIFLSWETGANLDSDNTLLGTAASSILYVACASTSAVAYFALALLTSTRMALVPPPNLTPDPPTTATAKSARYVYKVVEEAAAVKPDLIRASNTQTAKVSLDDCLACSGCVTSAETVLITQQSSGKLREAVESGRCAVTDWLTAAPALRQEKGCQARPHLVWG